MIGNLNYLIEVVAGDWLQMAQLSKLLGKRQIKIKMMN